MSRTPIAFLVAPLWVPAAMVPLAAQMFPHPAQRYWIYITVIISAIFAYGGTLALGVPAFLMLRARRWTSFRIATVLGFAIGGLTGMAFLVLFALSLGNSVAFIWHQAASLNLWLLPFGCGVLGLIVGATLWLIARPDLARAD